jgi:hypothetical protein
MSETHAPGEINTYALSCRLANDRPTGRPVLVWLVTTKSTTKCRRLVLESRNTQSIRGCLSKRMKFCDQCAIITGIHRQQSVLLRFPYSLFFRCRQNPENPQPTTNIGKYEALHSFNHLFETHVLEEEKTKRTVLYQSS